MSSINLLVTKEKVENLDSDDWCYLERMMAGESPNINALRNITMAMMVFEPGEQLQDENGVLLFNDAKEGAEPTPKLARGIEPLPEKLARARTKIKLKDWTEVAVRLFEAMSETAVPKQKGQPSSAPSQPEPALPVGS